MRKVDKASQQNYTGEIEQKELKSLQNNPRILKKYQSHRCFQNKRFYLDERGQKVKKDVIVYQDLVSEID